MKDKQNNHNGPVGHLQITGLERQHKGVLKGLSRCEGCEDSKGRCLWPQPPLWNPLPVEIGCRCDADICNQCGEPTWEYKLGSYFYVEATGMVMHARTTAASLHTCGWPRIQIPCAIEPDWDAKWGPLLAGFPVELIYIGVRPRNGVPRRLIIAKARYRLDLSSFSEDNLRKRICYVPPIESDYHVDVVWKKQKSRWEISKFKGHRLIAIATGSNFDAAMKHALLIGLQPDESAI